MNTAARLATIALLVFSTVPVSVTAQDAAGRRPERVAPELVEKARRDGTVPVIIGIAAGTETISAAVAQAERTAPHRAHGRLSRDEQRIARAQARMLARLPAAQRGGKRAARVFRFIPFIATSVDAQTLQALKAMPEVVSVQEDRVNHPTLQSSVPSIGGDLARAAGWTGAGQAIAILDTGVAGGSFMFSTRLLQDAAACFSGTADPNEVPSLCNPALPRCRRADGSAIPSSACGPNAAEFCGGPCGHGTHVTGIAAGDGLLSNGSRILGVAPQAGVIPVQVFTRYDYDRNGSVDTIAYDSDIIAGLEHVLALATDPIPERRYNVAAVNMSLGGDVSQTACDDDAPAMKRAIDNLRAVGIPTVIAAGNNGSSNGLSFPACISTAVSVAATGDTTGKAGFSNESAATSLAAPGVSITSAFFQTGLNTSQGTSMATPHVAGAMALLKQKAAHEGLAPTVDNLVAALQQTGQPMTGGRFAIPRVRVDLALDRMTVPLPLSIVLDDSLTPAALSVLSGTFTAVADVYAWGGRAWQATSGGGVPVMRFTPNLPTPGNYRVWAMWPVRAGNASATVATINHAGGSVQQTLNQTQQAQSGRWVDLGTWPFAVGTAGSVDLSAPSGSRLVADAVRYDRAPTPLLAFAIAPLPTATVGHPYDTLLTASGGVPPYRWSALTGLPPGLALDPFVGSLSGTPTAAGEFNLLVEVSDLTGVQAQAAGMLGVSTPAQTATLLLDDFERDDPGPWQQLLTGTVSLVGDAGQRVLRKTGQGDPHGGWAALPRPVTDFSLVLFTRKVDTSGGAVNRYTLTDPSGNGYGVFLAFHTGVLAVDRRTGWLANQFAPATKVPGGLVSNSWYTLTLRRQGTVVTASLYAGRVDPATATPLATASAEDATWTRFSQVNVNGGAAFDTDDLRLLDLSLTGSEPPSLVVLAPLPDANIRGQVELAVEARDERDPPDALVVEWAAGDRSWQPLGFDGQGQHNGVLDTGEFQNGPLVIHIRARDSDGLDTSDQVAVVVDNPVSPISLVADDFSTDPVGRWSYAATTDMRWLQDDVGAGIFRRVSGSDPAGAATQLVAPVADFDLVVYTRKVDTTGGAVNRYTLTDETGNGYGLFLAYHTSRLVIDRRQAWLATHISPSVPVTGGLSLGQWYTLRLRRTGDLLEAAVYGGRADPENTTPLAQTSTTDATVRGLTQFNINGGSAFDTDEVRVRGRP